MRHVAVALVVISALSAFAQSVPPRRLPGRMPPPAVYGAENFVIDYASGGGTNIQVVSPEGAGAQVWNDDGSLAGFFSVPFTFMGRPNAFYRFILFAPDGQVLLDQRYQVKQFLAGTLRQRGARPRQSFGARDAFQEGCGDRDFAAILTAIKQAWFGDDRVAVVALAARDNVFTVEQVGRMIDAMHFSSEQIKVVELTRDRIVDRQRAIRLLEHFKFSSDRDEVMALLK